MSKVISSFNYTKFVKYVIAANLLYLAARLQNPSNIKPMIILLVGFSAFIIYRWKNFLYNFPTLNGKLFTFYIVYIFLAFIRGFTVHNPDYIVIMSSGITISSVMLFSVIGTRSDMFRAYIHYFMLLALPFSLILYSITIVGTNDFPHFLSFFQLLLIATPFIEGRKIRLLIYVVNIMSFFYDMGDRSNFLNILGSLGILCVYLFILRKRLIHKFKYLYVLLPLIPLILVIAALYFQFNFFEYLSGQDEENDVVADSRTGIYMDVWSGLGDNDAYWFGLTSSGRYHTHLADLINGDYYFAGRSFCETNILNVLSMSGLCGAFLYLSFLVSCIYYALRNSNNDFCILLALYSCLKFCMIFIEEIQDFSLNHISFALTFGLCINNSLLKMTNDEIKQYFKICFPKYLAH